MENTKRKINAMKRISLNFSVEIEGGFNGNTEYNLERDNN